MRYYHCSPTSVTLIPSKACFTPDCIMLASSVISSLDTSKDPCEGFFDYASMSALRIPNFKPHDVVSHQMVAGSRTILSPPTRGALGALKSSLSKTADSYSKFSHQTRLPSMPKSFLPYLWNFLTPQSQMTSMMRSC